MTYISKVATLATQQAKLSKKDVFTIVEDMCRDKNPTLNMEQQAKLYKFFMTAAKPANTAFNWVSLAKSNEVTRPYLHYVYCDHEHRDGPMMVATDGHRLHICPAIEGMKHGFYDANCEWVDLDWTYPDYQRIIPMGGRSILWEAGEAKVVTVPGQGTPKGRYEFQTANGPMYCEQTYFDAARQKQECVTVHHSDQLSAMRLELDEQRTAVVMPVRMYGGVE